MPITPGETGEQWYHRALRECDEARLALDQESRLSTPGSVPGAVPAADALERVERAQQDLVAAFTHWRAQGLTVPRPRRCRQDD